MTDNRNTILAVILSGLVLLGWQYFFNIPQMEKQRAAQLAQGQTTKPAQEAANTAAPQTGAAPAPSATTPGANAPAANLPSSAAPVSRDTAIAATPRVKIDSPRLTGSISLKGARIDDLSLVQFRETVDPTSPAIVLYSPSGTDHPYYAEFGWVAASGSTVKIPDQNTIWEQEGTGSLTPSNPVRLKYDNGDGLTFRRTIAIDDRYLFTIKDDVSNVGNAPVTLYPFALISRHGAPTVAGYYILHEGLIGYLGDQGLQEYAYKKIDETKAVNFKVTNGWLGITDKYWASALLPDTRAQLQARFSSNLVGAIRTYQTDYLQDAQTIAIGGTGSASARLFAGAKEASVVGINFPIGGLGGYNKQLALNHFDLLIDWGWFYFITKPMFLALDFFYHLFGNFGIAILLVTVLVKLLFFPLANKSYASMAKMKIGAAAAGRAEGALSRRQGEAAAGDDGALQEGEDQPDRRLSSRSPCRFRCSSRSTRCCSSPSKCGTRRSIGWIKDLSAPDPTNLFNLFGLLHFDPTQLPLSRTLPRTRRLADHHGHHDVVPDEAQSDAARSDPADDLRLDAADLHLHARGLPGGSGDLLGVEQHAVGAAAELHHAPQWREG